MNLALSLTSQYEANKAILARPISSLAKMRGFKAEQIYDRLIPELAQTDQAEVMRYAEVGLRYATIVDRNRLREELGIKFIVAMEMIMNVVQNGLDSKEPWVKRKAMIMHGELIDEASEKQRFVDVIMAEKRLEMLKESQKNLNVLEAEIVQFEEQVTFPYLPDSNCEQFFPLVVYGQYC